MDFTGIYELESFYKHKNINWIDCLDIKGTRGYCSEEAKAKIIKRIGDYLPAGIHFIDSGNFHYVSEFWIRKINYDFILIVFDHHSDMIKSMFGDILSCGSWILNALKDNQYLKQIILIGIAQEQVDLIDPKYRERVIFLCDNNLGDLKVWKIIDELLKQYPVYFSIDKDVLSEQVVTTDWQQGQMRLIEFKLILADLIKRGDVIGIDICGECCNEVAMLSEIKNDDSLNAQILEFLKCELVK